MSKLQILDKIISNNTPALIIAEIGQAHDGSLGMAHSFIDAASEAGVDAIKFQTHIASAESTYNDAFRVKFSMQDDTRFDYWKRMEFTEEQWYGLAKHAADKNLIFLSSPFSMEAVDLLEKIRVPAWKIGSGEFKSEELMKKMIYSGKPILYSTGMSNWDEITNAVNLFNKFKTSFAILQCTSLYPTPSEKVGINIINEIKSRFNCEVGISDHSGKIFASLAAIVLGASIVEVHVTFDKRMFGPDTIASVTFEELQTLKEGRDEIFTMKTNPVDKDQLAIELENTRKLFTKSIAVNRSLMPGEKITEDILVPKKPGTGIPYNHKEQLIGKTVNKKVDSNYLLSWDDIEK